MKSHASLVVKDERSRRAGLRLLEFVLVDEPATQEVAQLTRPEPPTTILTYTTSCDLTGGLRDRGDPPDGRLLAAGTVGSRIVLWALQPAS